MEYDTNLKTFVTWNLETIRKIEQLTFRNRKEFENFSRSYLNVNILKIFVLTTTLWEHISRHSYC
jgi:hypothetical protein